MGNTNDGFIDKDKRKFRAKNKFTKCSDMYLYEYCMEHPACGGYGPIITKQIQDCVKQQNKDFLNEPKPLRDRQVLQEAYKTQTTLQTGILSP